MLTLVAGIVIQVAVLVVLVGWAMRKERRLRADETETVEGGVAHAVQHHR